MATTKGLDEAGLKVLQLECIISSKDKEISLLREHLSHDQEELIKHLQDENEALKRQLQQQQGAVGISSPTRQANGTSSRDAAAGHDSVVELNVSGTILTTTLSALQQVPGSKLAALVGGGSPQQQQLLDSQGRLFLPFEASAFSGLLSLLQASSVFGRSSPAFTALLRQHAPASNPYLQELIQHLRLTALLNPAAHGSSGHNAAAAPSSSHGPISGGSGAAVLRALGEAQGRPDSRGRAAVLSSSSGGGGGGSGGGAAAAVPGRQRRSSSPTGLLHGAGSGQGGAGAGHRGRGPSHQHHGHERHEKHEKQQQDKTPDPAATAAAAAAAAAAQSAAMQALTMRPAAQGSGGGAAHDASNVSNMPADLVASAALKGLVQGPKGVAG